MSRLYKFFMLLFLLLFVLSFIHGTLVSFGIYQLTGYIKQPFVTRAERVPFLFHIHAGLWNAIVYTAVQFFSLAFAFRMAYRQQKKFTVQNMIQYTGLFFLFTTIAYCIFAAWFALSDNLIGMLLLSGYFFGLPAPLWWLFPLLWVALFIFLAEKIKNKPEYGSQD